MAYVCDGVVVERFWALCPIFLWPQPVPLMSQPAPFAPRHFPSCPGLSHLPQVTSPHVLDCPQSVPLMSQPAPFARLKTTSIIWFNHWQFLKNSFLIFNTRFLSTTLENQWFIWYHNGKSFRICRHVCWELSLYLNVSHRVFELFWLFWDIENENWEQLFEIRGLNWGKNQFF